MASQRHRSLGEYCDSLSSACCGLNHVYGPSDPECPTHGHGHAFHAESIFGHSTNSVAVTATNTAPANSYGPYSYGPYSYGIYSCGIYSCGLHRYGLCFLWPTQHELGGSHRAEHYPSQ